jgi:hypothetical protein
VAGEEGVEGIVLIVEVGVEDGLEAAISSVRRATFFQLMHAEFKQPCCQL